mmetsp:Transcript_53737/g.172238  ORF Transcript_53737/g.172238 Transcript_53737/m.172238 type:complete len:270 (+) Transcript_53737:949-1758(+)
MEHGSGVPPDVDLPLVQRARPAAVGHVEDVEVADAVRGGASEGEAPLADEVEAVEGALHGRGPGHLDRGPRGARELEGVEHARVGLAAGGGARAAKDEELVLGPLDHLVGEAWRRGLPRASWRGPLHAPQVEPVQVVQGLAEVAGAATAEDDVEVVGDAGAVVEARRRRRAHAVRCLPREGLGLQGVDRVVRRPAVAPFQAGRERRRPRRPRRIVGQQGLLLCDKATEEHQVRVVALDAVAPTGWRRPAVGLQLRPLHVFDLQEVEVAI